MSLAASPWHSAKHAAAWDCPARAARLTAGQFGGFMISNLNEAMYEPY